MKVSKELLDKCEIVSEYCVLFSDGDNDIIYSGIAGNGDVILGVVICEDRKNSFLKYFHLPITPLDLVSFIKSLKSLRNIIQDSKSFFIIDKDMNDTIIGCLVASVKDIPKKYLPLENSYYPKSQQQ